MNMEELDNIIDYFEELLKWLDEEENEEEQ
jgi:hypothetical protein